MADGKIRTEQIDPEPADAVHGSNHSLGGSDPVEVADLAATGIGAGDVLTADGADGALWAPPAAPAAHAASHQNGGADEIDVTGLSGLLADPQTPALHAGTHAAGGGDDINVEDLATAGAADTYPASDGVGALTMLPTTPTEVALGAPAAFPVGFATIGVMTAPLTDGTYEVEYTAFIAGGFNLTSHNPQMKVRDTTAGSDVANTLDGQQLQHAALPAAGVSRTFKLSGRAIVTFAGGPTTLDLQASGTAADAAAGAVILTAVLRTRRISA